MSHPLILGRSGLLIRPDENAPHHAAGSIKKVAKKTSLGIESGYWMKKLKDKLIQLSYWDGNWQFSWQISRCGANHDQDQDPASV